MVDVKRKPLLQLRYEILERDNFTCQICGKRPPNIHLEVDHIVPVSEGGNNNPENLRASCTECNQGRGILTYKKVIAKKNNPASQTPKESMADWIEHLLRKWGSWPESELYRTAKEVGVSRTSIDNALHNLWQQHKAYRIINHWDCYEWAWVDPHSKPK